MGRTYLDVKQVAERLGVSQKTVRREVRSGRLPAIRIGRLIRIAEGDEKVLTFAPETATSPSRGDAETGARNFSQRARLS